MFSSAYVSALLYLTVSLYEPFIPIQAAIAVGTGYDVLVDLFECVANFLGRLRIHSEIPSTSAVYDILIKIMLEVLSVLALATKQVKQGRFSTLLVGHTYIPLVSELGTEKFAKKLLGEHEIETVIRRLDRLTDDEARMAVAQTLHIVYGLVSNVKVVMDGMQVLPACCKSLTRLV